MRIFQLLIKLGILIVLWFPLRAQVWENWTRGTIRETVDPSLQHSCAENMILKCMHIGLLCVQENPSDRPNMSDVILMLLGRSTTLPAPSRPAFLFRLDDTNQSHLEGAADLPRRSNKSNLSLNKGDDHRTWTEVAGPDYQLFSYNRIRGTLLFKKSVHSSINICK